MKIAIMALTIAFLFGLLLGVFVIISRADDMTTTPGKRSEPGERLSPNTLVYGNATYDLEAMKRYFKSVRDPFTQKQTKENHTQVRDRSRVLNHCIEYKDPWR